MALRKGLGLVTIIMIWPAIALLDACCTETRCTYTIGIQVTAFDNGGVAPVEVSSAPVRAEALMLRMIEADSVDFSGACAFNLTGLAPAAVATSCRELTTAVVYINIVEIISNNALDSTHPAGTNLLGSRFRSVTGDYKTDYSLTGGGIIDTATHVFTIRAILSNGDTLLSATSPLLLIP